MLCVLAMIAGMSILVSFLPVNEYIEYPDWKELKELVVPPAKEETNPEELEREIQAELARQRLAACADSLGRVGLIFQEYFRTDPAAIAFPADSVMDSFFAALSASDSIALRILHYGDSQIEEDRMSQTLRDSLQKRFGGGGPGMLPFANQHTLSTSSRIAGSYVPYSSFGFGGSYKKDRLYGPLGRSSHLESGCNFVASTIRNGSSSSYFNRLTVICANPSAKFSVSCADSSVTVRHDTSGTKVLAIRFSLPDSTTAANVKIGAGALVYGIQLDNGRDSSGRGGVFVDNAAMRGCSGTVFTRSDSTTVTDYCRLANVKLIIYQYGGNMVPACTGPKSTSHYCQLVNKELRHLRNVAPEASILFIGPSDMSTNIKGSMVSYPQLEAFADSLKATAFANGVAWWDLRKAMGGDGSMKDWVLANPPLAGRDYIHFTPKGAKIASGMLSDALLKAYDYYLYRMECKALEEE